MPHSTITRYSLLSSTTASLPQLPTVNPANCITQTYQQSVTTSTTTPDYLKAAHYPINTPLDHNQSLPVFTASTTPLLLFVQPHHCTSVPLQDLDCLYHPSTASITGSTTPPQPSPPEYSLYCLPSVSILSHHITIISCLVRSLPYHHCFDYPVIFFTASNTS